MATDPLTQYDLKVLTLTSATNFANFKSIVVIDAGGIDGFNIGDELGTSVFIPTGIPLSFGRDEGRVPKFLRVEPASGKSLNATVILEQ